MDDTATTGNYLGWPHHVGCRRWHIIIQGIGSNHILATTQLDIVDELSLTGPGMILTPVGNQTVLAVDERTTIKEVCHIIQTVEIQTVSTQSLSAVMQDHVLSGMHHLHLSVIISPFTSERQGITLTVMDMPEGLDGIGSLIEIGTITGKVAPLMGEGHLALHNLCIRIATKHIITEFISMQQIDAVSVRTLLTTLLGACMACTKQTQIGIESI